MSEYHCPNQLTPLSQWSLDLKVTSIDWRVVLCNMFQAVITRTVTVITRNFKLIQFQYKLLMRITTCRYMRYNMKIVTDNANCCLCNNALETISHIYLQCPHTLDFVNILNDNIRLKIDHSYRDLNKKHYIICNHDNPSINYLNLVAKWYLSKQFQTGNKPCWRGFVKLLNLALTGDKPERKSSLEPVINS